MGKQLEIKSEKSKMTAEQKAFIQAHNERIKEGGSLLIGKPKSQHERINGGLFAEDDGQKSLFD